MALPLAWLLALLALPPASQSWAEDRGIAIRERQEMMSEARVALVLGNGAYEGMPPLANAVADARLLGDSLEAAGFEVTARFDLGQNDMRRAIRDFGRALKAGGVGVFYYSGHGVQIDGANYLIPVKAQIEGGEDVPIEGVKLDSVLARMAAARNRVNIVVADACRNNPFPSKFRSATQGLAQVSAPRGTIVAYATSPGAVAADGEGENGPYALALSEHMRHEGMPVERVFKRVLGDVEDATGGRQSPWISASLRGDFYFVVPRPSQDPTPPQAAKDQAASSAGAQADGVGGDRPRGTLRVRGVRPDTEVWAGLTLLGAGAGPFDLPVGSHAVALSDPAGGPPARGVVSVSAGAEAVFESKLPPTQSPGRQLVGAPDWVLGGCWEHPAVARLEGAVCGVGSSSSPSPVAAARQSFEQGLYEAARMQGVGVQGLLKDYASATLDASGIASDEESIEHAVRQTAEARLAAEEVAHWISASGARFSLVRAAIPDDDRPPTKAQAMGGGDVRRFTGAASELAASAKLAAAGEALIRLLIKRQGAQVRSLIKAYRQTGLAGDAESDRERHEESSLAIASTLELDARIGHGEAAVRVVRSASSAESLTCLDVGSECEAERTTGSDDARIEFVAGGERREFWIHRGVGVTDVGVRPVRLYGEFGAALDAAGLTVEFRPPATVDGAPVYEATVRVRR